MIFFNISYLDNFIQLSHLIDAFPSYKTYKTASSGFFFDLCFDDTATAGPRRHGRGLATASQQSSCIAQTALGPAGKLWRRRSTE